MPKSSSRTRAQMIRAGLTAGAVGAALLVAPQPAYAAATVGPPIVPPGGNATISDPNANFNTTAAAVLMSQAACPVKYALAAVNGPWYGTVATRTATAVSFTVPTPGGPPAGANGAARAYFACVYDGAVLNTSNLQASAPIYIGTPPMVSAMSGITGGGNQLTVTAGQNGPIFTGLTSVAAVFTTGSCNPTLGSANPANLVATNVVRQSTTAVSLTVPTGVVAATGGAPTMYNICLYDGSSATGTLVSFVPYSATVATATPASGSYLSSTGVTVSSPSAFLSGVTAPAVLLVAGSAGCPGSYSTAAMGGGAAPMPLSGPGSVRKLSNNRAAVTIPPLPLMNTQPTTYQLCFYSGGTASGALVGTAAYTAAIVAAPTGVLPAAGPAAGGNTITVIGSDFPTEPGRITATLGGAPLTNIQPVNDKAFTAQVPAHAVEENVALVVTTSAGTKALPGAYSFRNPISVSPNTAPSTAPTVDVAVEGMGFMSINFGSTGNAGRVYLVSGVYNGADAGAGVRANGPVAECVDVLPISDQELVCTLRLNRRLNATGTGFFDTVAYTNSLTDVSTIAGSRVITSAAGKFSANDVGQPIVQATNSDIPANSTVTSILSPTKAVISAPALATSTAAFSATIGGSTPVRTFSNALTSTGSTTVSLTSGAFTRADVGRVINAATGIANGTTITAVAPGGATATLSAPATASTAGTLTDVTTVDGSATITSTAFASTDVGVVVGPNTIGIPVGATITAVTPGASATLSAPATVGGTATSVAVNRPVSGSLYAAAPVPDGSYNLVVVSNGAPDAAETDPDYFQTDITSSSAFTVASF